MEKSGKKSPKTIKTFRETSDKIASRVQNSVHLETRFPTFQEITLQPLIDCSTLLSAGTGLTWANMANTSSKHNNVPHQTDAKCSTSTFAPQAITSSSSFLLRTSPQCPTIPSAPVIKKTKKRFKASESRMCKVCGDVAKSNHFGGLSCNSCKAFFRQSVHKDRYLSFLCSRGKKKCIMTKSSRKSCQYCRIKRCFEIGMDKRWVMSEDERKALMMARTEKKLNVLVAADSSNSYAATIGDSQQNLCSSLQTERSVNMYVPQLDCMIKYMCQSEINEIQSLVRKYEQAYQQLPFRAGLRSFDLNRPGVRATEILATMVKRFALYARMMPHFACLANQDQRILLKNGVLEMCLLRSAFVFDLENNCWPNTSIPMYKESPILNLDDVRKMASKFIIEKHLELIRFIQQSGIDEPMTMLLAMIVLFTSRPGLSRPDLVEKFQTFYTTLLKRYTSWHFGPVYSFKVFSKFLTKLSDLRELSESHNEQNLHFESDEILSIQQELKDLKISPFPEYNVFNEETTHRQGSSAAIFAIGKTLAGESSRFRNCVASAPVNIPTSGCTYNFPECMFKQPQPTAQHLKNREFVNPTLSLVNEHEHEQTRRKPHSLPDNAHFMNVILHSIDVLFDEAANSFKSNVNLQDSSVQATGYNLEDIQSSPSTAADPRQIHCSLDGQAFTHEGNSIQNSRNESLVSLEEVAGNHTVLLENAFDELLNELQDYS